ncbi:expressed unknown protein [Seminavis robusta]|uniref:Uncharacterized protein n=1 Tax=Seminavis robusta TaxID=568900 RepID=A0A9N8HHF4_9STRA|nr:expressed unknown protein [Seminavis robusta]|eukprot:Sro632_g178690.1 n/a (666) ;mRNA; r:24090-26087
MASAQRGKPVSRDDFNKSLTLINFRLCEEAKNWKGSPNELLNKWIPLEVGDVAEDRDNAKLGGVPDHCLARASMQIMISSFFAGAIPSQYRKSEHFAEQYFKSFFMYSLLTSLPHLITPNIGLIGLPGFNNISEFLDVSVQIKEQDGNQLTWKSGQNGHGFGFVGASIKESRNGLVGECLVAALRYFEGRCEDTTNNEEFQRAMVDLRQRLIDLLQKIKEIRAELEIKPLNVAKIGELKIQNVARALTIHVLQSGMEYREMMKKQEKVPSKKEFEDARPTGFAKESWKLLHEVLDTGDLSKWASKKLDEDKIAKKGETQLALFCLGWPDSPLHTYLCRWMCASLNSVKEVRETAEEMIAKANVDAKEQEIFIHFVEDASRCLGSKSLAPVVGISDIRDRQKRDEALEQAKNQEQQWRIDQETRMTKFIGTATKLLGFLQRLEEEANVGEQPDFLQRQREAHLLAEEEANAGERPDDNPKDGDNEDYIDFVDADEFSCEGDADQMLRRDGQALLADARLQDTTICNKGAKSDVFQLNASYWRRHLFPVIVSLGLILVFPSLRAFYGGIGGTPGNPPVQEPAPKITNELQRVEPTTGQAGVNVGPVETEGGVAAEPTLGAGDLNPGLKASDGTSDGEMERLLGMMLEPERKRFEEDERRRKELAQMW